MPFCACRIGCFEQTSSSTYPNVLALDYMKRTKKLTPEVHAKAEGFIANGYQRLLTFEVPGGGFSWFGNAPANKILTAYGLMEFYDMSRVHDVDPKLISRTQQWLASQQLVDGSWKPDTQFINEGATNRYNSDVLRITAYLAWALKDTGYQGPAVEKAKQFVEKHMTAKVDTYTLAVVANFAADYGADRAFTRQAIDALDTRTEKDKQVGGVRKKRASMPPGRAPRWRRLASLCRRCFSRARHREPRARLSLTSLRRKMLMEPGAPSRRRSWRCACSADRHRERRSRRTRHGGGPAERQAIGKARTNAENNDLLHQFVFKNINTQLASTVGLPDFEESAVYLYQIVTSTTCAWR